MVINSKPKVNRLNKLSGVQWVLLGIVIAGTCFGLVWLWMKVGFCIPCWVENIWNALQFWVKTGVFPFW